MATSILPDKALTARADQTPRVRIALREEPPRCQYNNVHPATRHPDGLNSRTCPTCTSHARWVAAIRRQRIAAGLHVPDPLSNRGKKPDPGLRKPAPKCRLRHATDAERKACETCLARRQYTSALLRDARRDGQGLVGLVDAAPSVRHITEVLIPSGMTLKRISERSGVNPDTLSRACRGCGAKILAINATAILAIEPMPYRRHGRGDLINATGTRRLLRGLYAQGWKAGYMAELEGNSKTNIWRVIAGVPGHGYTCEFVTPEIAAAAKRLADKLGPFDIAELAEPMDGMSIRCANRAAKRGWNVLADWDGLDIDDPRITPHGADTMPASNGLVLVDADKVRIALDFHPVEQEGGTLRAHPFTSPVTMLELCEIIRVGSEPDRLGEPRFSANLLAQRLGIAERTVQRYRADLALADRALDARPSLAAAALAAGTVLAAAEWPAVLRLQAAADLLRDYQRRGFYRELIVLSATQPRPYGRGWDDAGLAAWLGCTEQAAAAIRARATLAGRQYYDRPTAPGGRPRRLGTEQPATTKAA